MRFQAIPPPLSSPLLSLHPLHLIWTRHQHPRTPLETCLSLNHAAFKALVPTRAWCGRLRLPLSMALRIPPHRHPHRPLHRPPHLHPSQHPLPHMNPVFPMHCKPTLETHSHSHHRMTHALASTRHSMLICTGLCLPYPLSPCLLVSLYNFQSLCFYLSLIRSASDTLSHSHLLSYLISLVVAL